MYCTGGNATDPIWRLLASSDRISSWNPLKPQHSKPNRYLNPLANQLWCIDLFTPPTPLIITHRLPAFLESLMSLKNWCSIHSRWSKSNLKHSTRFCGIFPSLKQNFIAYCSSSVSDWIFEIHQLWQSGFSRVHSNSYCSCSFESKIIKLVSHLISCIAITYSRVCDNFKCLYEKSLETYCMRLVCCRKIVIWLNWTPITIFFFNLVKSLLKTEITKSFLEANIILVRT